MIDRDDKKSAINTKNTMLPDKTFERNEKYAVGHTVLWHIFMSVCAHPVCILIKEAKMDKHVSVARDRIS